VKGRARDLVGSWRRHGAVSSRGEKRCDSKRSGREVASKGHPWGRLRGQGRATMDSHGLSRHVSTSCASASAWEIYLFAWMLGVTTESNQKCLMITVARSQLFQYPRSQHGRHSSNHNFSTAPAATREHLVSSSTCIAGSRIEVLLGRIILVPGTARIMAAKCWPHAFEDLPGRHVYRRVTGECWGCSTLRMAAAVHYALAWGVPARACEAESGSRPSDVDLLDESIELSEAAAGSLRRCASLNSCWLSRLVSKIHHSESAGR